MINELLNREILKTLARVECGLREKTLRASIEIALDRQDMTTVEFEDAVLWLAERGLIEYYRNILEEKIWGLTALGRDALKGI